MGFSSGTIGMCLPTTEIWFGVVDDVACACRRKSSVGACGAKYQLMSEQWGTGGKRGAQARDVRNGTIGSKFGERGMQVQGK